MSDSFQEKSNSFLKQAQALYVDGMPDEGNVAYSKAASYAPPTKISSVYQAWAKDALAIADWDNALFYATRAVELLHDSLDKVMQQEVKRLQVEIADIVTERKEKDAREQAEWQARHKAAVDASGGIEPGDRRFLQSMETRANQLLGDKGWPELRARLNALPLKRTKLIKDKKSKKLPVCTESFVRGQPYAERGSSWPRCAPCRKEMSFILQVDTRKGDHEKLQGTGLVQLFICRVCEKKFRAGVIKGGFEIRNFAHAEPAKFVEMPTKKPPRKGYSLAVRKGDYNAKPNLNVLKTNHPDIARDIALLYPPDPAACYDELLDVEENWHYDYDYPRIFVGNYTYIHRDSRGDQSPLCIVCEHCNRAMDVVFDATSLGSGGKFLDDAHAYVFNCACDRNKFCLVMGY